MNCESVQPLISKFSDGELSYREIDQMFIHLGSCSACRSFFADVMRIGHLLEEIQEKDLEGDLPRFGSPIRTKDDIAGKRAFLENILKKRVAIPFPAAVVLIVILTMSAFFVRFGTKPKSESTKVLITTHPVVEVKGYYHPTENRKAEK